MGFLGKCILKDINSFIPQYSSYFSKFEVGLTRFDLENLDKTKKILERYEDKIYTLHIPHITDQEINYLKLADELASYLDCLLLIHSYRLITTAWKNKVFYNYYPKSEFMIENNPGDSFLLIESVLNEFNLCLDIAHLYIAYPVHKEFINNLGKILKLDKKKIKLIHIADSTRLVDNLPLGEGEINFGKIINLFEGFKIVIEVMPEYQLKGKKFLENLVREL